MRPGLSILLAATASGCASARWVETEEWTIRVRAQVSERDVPIAGARVRAWAADEWTVRGYSDARGHCEFRVRRSITQAEGWRGYPYRGPAIEVEVTKDGFRTFRKTLDFSGRDMVPRDLLVNADLAPQ